MRKDKPMKYYDELSSEDKDRALRKLMFKPMVRFNCLLRVLALGEVTVDSEEQLEYKPASVARFFWYDNDMYADIVFDHDQSKMVTAQLVDNFKPCLLQEPEPQTLSYIDSDIAKKALETLLTSGKNYVFDEKCNAYPV